MSVGTAGLRNFSAILITLAEVIATKTQVGNRIPWSAQTNIVLFHCMLRESSAIYIFFLTLFKAETELPHTCLMTLAVTVEFSDTRNTEEFLTLCGARKL